MFLNISHQELNNDNRRNKCCYHTDQKNYCLCSGKVQAKLHKLQKTCTEHNRNRKYESEFSSNGSGYSKDQSTDNCCTGSGCSREDCSDQLEKSDQKCSLISKFIHTVDLRRFALVIILNNDKGDTEDNQSNRNARVIVKPFLKQIIERHSNHNCRDTCNKNFQPENNDIHLYIT